MIIIISSIIIFIFIGIMIFSTNKKSQSRLVIRFKNRFKDKNHHREKLKLLVSDSLMNDPESNIKIYSWDSESDLREKADIHRARLHRYGRSKMNGKMLFMGPKGGVYLFTQSGNRKYL